MLVAKNIGKTVYYFFFIFFFLNFLQILEVRDRKNHKNQDLIDVIITKIEYLGFAENIKVIYNSFEIILFN